MDCFIISGRTGKLRIELTTITWKCIAFWTRHPESIFRIRLIQTSTHIIRDLHLFFFALGHGHRGFPYFQHWSLIAHAPLLRLVIESSHNQHTSLGNPTRMGLQTHSSVRRAMSKNNADGFFYHVELPRATVYAPHYAPLWPTAFVLVYPGNQSSRSFTIP